MSLTVYGPIAQRSEPPAHNRSVPGSNPGGPTTRRNGHGRDPKTRANSTHGKHSVVYTPRPGCGAFFCPDVFPMEM